MLRSVPSTANHLQVRAPVVQRVPVLVVDLLAARDAPAALNHRLARLLPRRHLPAVFALCRRNARRGAVAVVCTALGSVVARHMVSY